MRSATACWLSSAILAVGRSTSRRDRSAGGVARRMLDPSNARRAFAHLTRYRGARCQRGSEQIDLYRLRLSRATANRRPCVRLVALVVELSRSSLETGTFTLRPGCLRLRPVDTAASAHVSAHRCPCPLVQHGVRRSACARCLVLCAARVGGESPAGGVGVEGMINESKMPWSTGPITSCPRTDAALALRGVAHRSPRTRCAAPRSGCWDPCPWAGRSVNSKKASTFAHAGRHGKTCMYGSGAFVKARLSSRRRRAGIPLPARRCRNRPSPWRRYSVGDCGGCA